MATISMELENRKQLFTMVQGNKQKIGHKTFAYVPVSLLFVDDAFQRNESAREVKIAELARNFDINKMDALKVSPHAETYNYSVIDGYHRLEAAKINKIEMLEVEILDGLSDDPDKRKKQEATIFATQNDQVETLSPMQKHKANLVRGVKENIGVQAMIDKYGVSLKKAQGRGGKSAANSLTGFKCALQIVKTYGTEMLDDIFKIVCGSRWNLDPKGFGNLVMSTLRNILALHPDYKEAIINTTTELFRQITPNQLVAAGVKAYPNRKPTEQTTLILEDYLHAKLGMPIVFLAKDTTLVRQNIAA